MYNITGNEPAMPCVDTVGNGQRVEPLITGLTIRQQFAMAAMQGLSSALWVDCTARNCAKKAVEYADALINQLNKEVTNV